MEDYPAAKKEAPSGKIEGLTELRHRVADFLRANKESLVSQVEREVEVSVRGYESLPADLVADVRQSFRDFLQLYLDYFEAEDFPDKYIRSYASEVGRKRAKQGLGLTAVIGGFDAGESYVWNRLVEELVPGEHPSRAWVEVAGMRDRFTKLVRHFLRGSYTREERNTIQKQLEEFRALSYIGQTIVSTMDLEKVLGQILEVATSLMQTRMGSIMLLDQGHEYLEPVVDIGLSRGWVQKEKVPLRQSLSGVAIRRREHVLAKDAELTAFKLPKAAVGRKIRSALSIPITVDEEPIGVIELYDTVPRAYTDIDITMLMTFGPQAGAAIKNARLFQEEQKQRRQASIMAEIAQAVSGTRDLDELLDIITEKAAVALGVDRASLFFYEPEANALTFMAGYGRSTLQIWLLNQFHVPMEEIGEATAKAIRTKKPVLSEEPGEELSLESRIFRGPGVHAYLQVPLAVEDELIGLLSLEFTKDEYRLIEDDILLAEALASQMAIAIQNRRLQEKLFEQQFAIRNAEVNERLYRERERSEAVLKATPDAVLLVDRDMKVLMLNPAAEFLTGWTLKEAQGRDFHEIIYGSKHQPESAPTCPIEKVFAGEHIAYSDEELVTRSGRRVPSGGTFAPIYGPAGKVENVVAVYRDISEQKELEKYAIVQKEMDIASGVQSSLLPRQRLLTGGVNIYARQKQARMVGGDWYDYWSYGDKLYLVVGDASGNGIGAALFATMAMSTLRVEAHEHDDPREVLTHVNSNLILSNQSESFVTVFLGVLDIPTMTLTYSNAGHEDPMYIGAEARNPDFLTAAERSILGVFSRAELSVNRRKFNSGERLVLYTDGVLDAQNSRGKFYGLKRLNRFVTANRGMPAEAFIDALIESVLEFCDGEAKDDITVMVCDIP